MTATAPLPRGGPFTARELAAHLGGALEGDGEVRLTDVRTLEDAGPEHLSFLANRRYLRQLAGCRAGAVVLDRGTDAKGHTAIRCDDPYQAFARALALFHPLEWPQPGVDPRAWVAADATVGEGVTVEAFAWIGPGARVGEGTWIEAGAYVGRGARVGRSCHLMAGSVVGAGCWLGDRVWLNPGVIIGGEGFGFARGPAGHLKVPQVARAVIEDDVEIGANSCVDRGSLRDTVVRRGAKLDNLVQVGHGAEIGEESLLAAFAGIAGSARLGKRVVMAGKTGVADHRTVGDGVRVAVQSVVMEDQPAGAQLAGSPAIDHRRWLRAAVAFADLPEMARRLRKLERRLAELESGASGEEE